MSLGQLLVYPLRGQGGVLWVLCAAGLFVLLALFEWTRLGEGQQHGDDNSIDCLHDSPDYHAANSERA